MNRQQAYRMRCWSGLRFNPINRLPTPSTGRLPITQALETAANFAATRGVVASFAKQFDPDIYLSPCLEDSQWFSSATPSPQLSAEEQTLLSEYTLDMGALLAAKIMTEQLREPLFDTLGHLLHARSALTAAESQCADLYQETTLLTIALESKESALAALQQLPPPNTTPINWHARTNPLLQETNKAFVLAGKRIDAALEATLLATHGDNELVASKLHQAMGTLTASDIGLVGYQAGRYESIDSDYSPTYEALMHSRPRAMRQ
jgi:hypothetical protein